MYDHDHEDDDSDYYDMKYDHTAEEGRSQEFCGSENGSISQIVDQISAQAKRSKAKIIIKKIISDLLLSNHLLRNPKCKINTSS